MKFDSVQKETLLTAASDVYKGFVALEFFKNRKFKTNAGEYTLLELCQNNQSSQQVTLEGQVFELKLTSDLRQGFSVSLNRPLKKEAAVRKPITEYTPHEALALLSNQSFHLEKDAQNQFQVKTRIQDKVDIGGIGKMDLYNTHLVTLNNIIEKIQSEEDVSNLLVALATGSGKTFVQALWALVMHLSGNNAVFALPDKLISQFQSDLRRILPDDLVNEFVQLKQEDDALKAQAVLEPLKSKNAKPQIVIASSERLLDKHYQQLLELDPKFNFLSFDEQHLLMKKERHRVRLIELSKKMLSLFLTATPNKETYELCGNRPVAIMSSGQKEAAGQGQFPVIYKEHARNISDRNALKDYRFWTLDFWQNMLRGLFLRFASAIQVEQSSAALSLVENMPFYMHRKPGENNVRWSMQVPMARKMLWIIDDNEDLVNFCRALKESNERVRNVYRNGNVVDRSDISGFFQLPEFDGDIISEDMRQKRASYLAGLTPEEQVIGERLARKSLKEQLKETIFHNMVEYVLSDLTGLDEIAHNKLRKENPKAFEKLIRERFKLRDASYYQEKLASKIDDKGAKEIAGLLSRLSSVLQESMQHNRVFSDFVDNWVLNDGLMGSVRRFDRHFHFDFDNYAERNFMMGVMTGMKNAETPIEESRPFIGLDGKSYDMYDKDGVLVKEAKRRQHSALETLNDTSKETRYKPQYLEVAKAELDKKKLSIEEVCNNYFRLGFTACLASNKHTEGFSDTKLHTVVNISEKTLSSTNSPETLIQGIGRNRGLDDTVVPAFIHGLGRKQQSIFDLDHLKLADYYPKLFPAQNKYNKEFIEVLGKAVGQEIIAWYNEQVKIDDSIDADRLKKQVFKIIAKALRHLNNNNNHKIKLSRAQLTKVISAAMSTLNEEITRTNNPYRLPLSTRVLGSVLNFMSEVYYSFKRIVPAYNRFMHSWFGNKSALAADAVSKVHPDDVYIKIINKTDFKRIIANMSALREFKGWLDHKKEGIEFQIKNKIGYFLNPKFRGSLSSHKQETVIPLLVNSVVADKKDQVASSIKRLPSLIGFMEENKQELEDLFNSFDNPEFEKQLLNLLHKIPGLGDLALTDVINYPKLPKNYFAQLSDAKLIDIARIVKDKLLPALVNVFPLKDRKRILDSIGVEKIKQVLKTKGDDLVGLLSGKSDEKEVVKLFELLVGRSLPEPINMEQDIEKSTNLLQAKFDEIMRASKFNLGIKKLFDFSSWSSKKEYIYDKPIADLIKSDVFLESISLMFPFNDWILLKTLFNQNPAATLQLARALIDDIVANNGSVSLDPKRFIELINETFRKTNTFFIPLVHTETAMEQAVTRIQEESVVDYLMSKHFAAILEQIFNPKDKALLAQFLADKSRVIAFAKKVIAKGLDKLDEKSLMDLLQSEESLKDIHTLGKRMDLFGDFLKEFENLKRDVFLDRNKLFAFVTDTGAPVLFHKKFYTLLNELIGFLNEEDLTVIFNAMGEKEPRQEAVSILQLLQIIKAQDKRALQKHFFTIADGEELDIEKLPIKKAIDLLTKLFDEVLDCQCYYNQHDRKGEQFLTVPKPKLWNQITPEFRSMRVDAPNSFFSGMSRKLFFIQGIRNGLPKASEISAVANQNRAKVFAQINNHILRPMWWGLNTSKWSYALVTLGKDIAFSMKAFGFSMLNGLKRIANFVMPGTAMVSQRNPTSKHYNDTAFDVAKGINELTAFDAPKVADVHCADDTVTHTEEGIAKQKPHFDPSFFALSEASDEGAEDTMASKKLG